MKIEVKSKKGLRTILSVVVDKKNIQEKMDEKLKELQKEVALKGFRPGKVPPAVIVPAANLTLYPDLFIDLAAIIPNIVTDAPTIPVAAAKTTETNKTA